MEDIQKELENVKINNTTPVFEGITEVKKPITVVFCLPGKSFSGTFLQQWTDLFSECLKRGIKPYLSQSYSPVVHYARLLCLGTDNLAGEDQIPFRGKIDYDYIMWIDSDIIFNVDSFLKLMESPHDVTCGLYRTQNRQHFPVVKDWDEKFFLENGRFDFLTEESIKEWNEKTKERYMDVEYSGMGFMLMKKGVFEKIKFPWFYRDNEVMMKDGMKIVAPPSEDVSLCKNLKDVGVNIYVDVSVVVGHLKDYIV